MQTKISSFLYFFILIISPIFYSLYYGFIDVFVFLVFLVLFFSSFGIVFSSNAPFTLTKVYYIFSYIFFGIIPLNDHFFSVVYWGGTLPSIDVRIITILIILFSVLCMNFFNIYFSRHFKVNKNAFSFNYRLKINHFNLIFLSLVFCFIIFKKSDFNLIKMLVRGFVDADVVINDSGQIDNLFFNNIIKPLPLLFFYFYAFSTSKYNYFTLFVLFILSFIFVAPTSMPRYQTAALYFPLLFLIAKVFFKNPNFYSFTIISSIFFLFPFLNKFRNFSFDSFEFTLDFNFLREGHFDAFNNFCLVINHDVVTFGKQLFTVLFFFIPRNVWPEKSIGSGAYIAEISDLSFSNISMPLLAEFYINFGLIGFVILLPVLFFYVCKFDMYVWSKSKPNITSFIYIFFINMFFFINRGDLLSSFAYSVALIFILTFLYILLVKIYDK